MTLTSVIQSDDWRAVCMVWHSTLTVRLNKTVSSYILVLLDFPDDSGLSISLASRWVRFYGNNLQPKDEDPELESAAWYIKS